VVIGGTLGVQGWRLYRATAAQKPIAGLYDEISSRPGFASCDQLPQTYIDAVISVEDSRFERHHGIDPAAIVRALWADLRTRSLAEGGSTLNEVEGAMSGLSIAVAGGVTAVLCQELGNLIE